MEFGIFWVRSGADLSRHPPPQPARLLFSLFFIIVMAGIFSATATASVV